MITAAASTLCGKTVVINYEGTDMASKDLNDKFCENVAALQNLGIRMVIVHGWGPQVDNMLHFLAVVSSEDVRYIGYVAKILLCGGVNKEISSKICSKGGLAIGLSGRDDSLLQ